ncbi:MAG: aminotransferase class V-fold PLP-dependent enzyme [Candidatus Hodarchaeales archaeon]
MMNIQQIRRDFPTLSTERNGMPIVYLDSACMSLKPKQVIEVMNRYYTENTACAGRSPHKFSIEVTEAYEEARHKLGNFINAKEAAEIVWTKNTTEGVNIVMQGMDWKDGDVIISDSAAHNSNLIPWINRSAKGTVKHVLMPVGVDGKFDIEKFEELMSANKVKLVSFCHTSNVTGVTIPAKDICKIVHDHGSLFMLDAAQSVPHRPVDVQDIGVDFIAGSMHKALGPTGTGFLYGKYDLLDEINSLILGGETVQDVVYPDKVKYSNPPNKFEAGLQDYAGIIGVGAAVDYLSKIGMENIEKYEHELAEKLIKGLLDMSIDGFKLIGPPDSNRCALAAFYIQDIHSHDLAILMDEKNIFLRAGFHCTHGFHHSHGLHGTLRPSGYLYNTIEEIKFFLDSLEEIISFLL